MKALAVSLLISLFLVSELYVSVRDVELVSYHAQVSTNARAMLNHIQQLKSGMERHGMTRKESLAELNNSVVGIITRLEMIVEMPQTNLVYQTVLNDTRLIISDLWGPSPGHLLDKYWFLFLIMVGFFIQWASGREYIWSFESYSKNFKTDEGDFDE